MATAGVFRDVCPWMAVLTSRLCASPSHSLLNQRVESDEVQGFSTCLLGRRHGRYAFAGVRKEVNVRGRGLRASSHDSCSGLLQKVPSEVRNSQQRQKFWGKTSLKERISKFSFLFFFTSEGLRTSVACLQVTAERSAWSVPPSSCDWHRTGRREDARPRGAMGSGSNFPRKHRKSPLSHTGHRSLARLHFCASWAGLSGPEQEEARVGPGIMSNPRVAWRGPGGGASAATPTPAAGCSQSDFRWIPSCPPFQ